MPPLVTIAIPNYNYGRYLDDCIGSVLAQTYTDFELLISDNCSSDNSLDIINKYNDKRISYWVNDSNIGAYPNWDLLYSKAKGKYFKLLQADDWLHPDYLKVTIERLEEQRADVAFAGFGLRGEEESNIIPSEIGIKNTSELLTQEDICKHFDGALGNFIHPTTNIFKKEIVPEGYGGTKESFFQDMVLWAKLLTRGKVIVIDQILSYQRMHGTQDRKTRRDTSMGIYECLEAYKILSNLNGTQNKIEKSINYLSGNYFTLSLISFLKINIKQGINIIRNLFQNSLLLRGVLHSGVHIKIKIRKTTRQVILKYGSSK